MTKLCVCVFVFVCLCVCGRWCVKKMCVCVFDKDVCGCVKDGV